MRRLSALALALAAAGCAPPPEADVSPTPAAVAGPPPRLQPTADFVAASAAAPTPAVLASGRDDLAARAAALEARAGGIAVPVIDAGLRPRLAAPGGSN